MLLANEAVATRLMAQRRPAVYRIHEAPDERKLRDYREEVLSHRIPCGNLTVRNEVQKVLATLKQNPIGPALKVGFLRSLMRARYSVEPLGHYGLAKKKYTHFTSPIRRYSDLLVHRALFNSNGQLVAQGSLAEIADRISETERNSSDAERDSKDVKMMAYLGKQLTSASPHRYPALVTDVRNFGFFVDVPDLGLSGLVPLSGITDDFYQFDPARSHLVGRRTRRVFKLGDRLEVQVAKVDTFKKQVDFELATTGRPKAIPQRPGIDQRKPKSEIGKPKDFRGPKPQRWGSRPQKPRGYGGQRHGRPGAQRKPAGPGR
jgi:ribonuclease R